MRVYEFSKQFGIPAKELIEILRQGGFEVNSHMSTLSQSGVDFLNKKLRAESEKTSENKKESTQAQASQVPQEPHARATNPVVESAATQKNEQKTETAEEKSPVSRVEVAKKEKQVGGIELRQMTVVEAALQLQKPVNEVILTLLKLGVLANKNQVLLEKTVGQLATHYQIPVIKDIEEKKEGQTAVSRYVATAIHERPPVVVVIGHVDHGKTTLLDFIRKTRVASREKGGITQHLGAYEASIAQGKVTFLDTPGHEAFSKMRMRGIKVADLAILVIAADDGVMPQTIEAINHARAIELPIIVAVNKMDKVEPSRIETIKRELSKYNLMPEEWGGQTVYVPISAKLGTGIDQLLEMVILQAQLMELRADKELPARGFVLESKIEKGRGPVATFLSQHGTLRVGDFFVCGNTYGRVNSLVDTFGARVKEVGPSIPVQVAGFSQLPEAGDFFEVLSASEQQLRMKKMRDSSHTLAGAMRSANKGIINLIIKTDSNSSKEALLGSIEKLSKSVEKGFSIVHAGVGGINESDVILAANTGSSLWGLHVKIEPNANALAQKHEVEVHLYGIIYKLIEELQKVAHGAQDVKMVRVKTGEAVVRKVFDIKGIGVIAGSYVRDGKFSRDGSVVIWRGNKKAGEGKIKSLQRDKKIVKEVHAGFECGFLIDGFTAWEIDDRVECFVEVPEAPKK